MTEHSVPGIGIKRHGLESLTLLDDVTGLRLEIDRVGDGLIIEAYDYYGRKVEMSDRGTGRPHPEVSFVAVEPLPEGKTLPVPQRTSR